jgi:hypothetical protein
MNATQPQPNTHVDVDVAENKEWCGDALGSDTQAAACSFGLSATSQQYFSLRTNQPSVTSRNQPAVLFSQNKPAPAISHRPTEQALVALLTVEAAAEAERSMERRVDKFQITPSPLALWELVNKCGIGVVQNRWSGARVIIYRFFNTRMHHKENWDHIIHW